MKKNTKNMSRKAALARKRFCNFVAEANVAVITDQKNNYFLPTMKQRTMRSLPIKFGDNRVEKTRWMFVCLFCAQQTFEETRFCGEKNISDGVD